MKNTKKVYVVGSQLNYANVLSNYELVSDLNEADIVIFTGGEDVTPSLYHCKQHSSTFCNIKRDLYEKSIFEQIRPDQLVIGICRGSQFLCVMNGGKLIQDVDRHAISHTHQIIEIETNKIYDITSTHHQMQYPFEMPRSDYDILFISYEYSSCYYEGDGISIPTVEPEIVLYHKSNSPKCLAIQGHPEYMRSESPIVIRINQIVNTLLKDIKTSKKDEN